MQGLQTDAYRLATRCSVVIVLLMLSGACSSIPRQIAAPDLRVVALSLLDAGVDGQRFRVSLEVTNPNDFAVPVAELRFTLRLSGEGILNGLSEELRDLPARDSLTILVDVQTELVSSISRLLALAQGPDDAIAYEMNGQFALPTRAPRFLPFSVSGQVPLSASMGAR